LRDSVICKHRDLIDIIKRPITLAFEACPYICYEYLGALVKPNFPAFKNPFVVEAREILYNEID